MKCWQWLKFTLVCTLTYCAFIPTPVHACAVPVYRYALERDSWRPSPYPVLLFYRGTLNQQTTNALRKLEAAENLYMDNWSAENKSADIEYPANIDIEVINIDEPMTDNIQALWTKLQNPTLPRLAVCLPLSPASQDLLLAWSGDVSIESVRKILDSPVRREIPQMIAKGNAATWIFLECGNQAKDTAAAKIVQHGLDTFINDFQFSPEAIMAMQLESEEDMKLSFSVIHMKRHDPDEVLLENILLNAKPDLMNIEEPMIFPVLGRGRALWALVGKAITVENIQDACDYVTGGCSCEIKWQNPGIDLLVSADWYKVLAGVAPPPLSHTAISNNNPQTIITADSTKSNTLRNLLITGIILLLIVAIISVVLVLLNIFNKKKENR
ncbi:MAG: hypothetical protein KAH23_02130 [Kiritimatiellae bacterium]|nr:hypothetical protein [Kiritimatiellia bacterium]